MPKFPIRIVQTFRVRQEIVVDVEADTADEAPGKQAKAATPSANAGWQQEWDLQDEDVRLATPAPNPTSRKVEPGGDGQVGS